METPVGFFPPPLSIAPLGQTFPNLLFLHMTSMSILLLKRACSQHFPNQLYCQFLADYEQHFHVEENRRKVGAIIVLMFAKSSRRSMRLSVAALGVGTVSDSARMLLTRGYSCGINSYSGHFCEPERNVAGCRLNVSMAPEVIRPRLFILL